MSDRSVFKSVHPIGDTDPKNLPVPSVEQAAPYYQERMGFDLASKQEAPVPSITLRRDSIEIVLAENGGDPEQASCYIETSDVDQARTELQSRGCNVSEIRNEPYGGASYRVFFVRAPDGLCYCLGQKQS
jgi:hypothetical protein